MNGCIMVSLPNGLIMTQVVYACNVVSYRFYKVAVNETVVWFQVGSIRLHFVSLPVHFLSVTLFRPNFLWGVNSNHVSSLYTIVWIENFFSFSLCWPTSNDLQATSSLNCGFRCMNPALYFSGTVGCKFKSTLQNLHYHNDFLQAVIDLISIT